MKYHSEDYKITAVKHYLRIKSYDKVCDIFECSKSSLIRWVKKYSEDGKIISNHNKTKVSYRLEISELSRGWHTQIFQF